MDDNEILSLLAQYKQNQISAEEILHILSSPEFALIGDFAKLDITRKHRTGFPEVIFAQGKTPQQIIQSFKKLLENNSIVFATRVSQELHDSVKENLPDASYSAEARILFQKVNINEKLFPGIVVLTAGTTDIPIAEEAALTAELFGNQVERIFDVGVAGIHRIFHYLPILQKANVVIVTAGMEGALPSVVGGLVSAPVIAVPTSVGYGASFSGVSALLGMLNSCSNGLAVVNIDNGFGAGSIAARINRKISLANRGACE